MSSLNSNKHHKASISGPILTSMVIFLAIPPARWNLIGSLKRPYSCSQPGLILTNPIPYPSDLKISHQLQVIGPPVSPTVHSISQIECWSHQSWVWLSSSYLWAMEGRVYVCLDYQSIPYPEDKCLGHRKCWSKTDKCQLVGPSKLVFFKLWVTCQ